MPHSGIYFNIVILTQYTKEFEMDQKLEVGKASWFDIPVKDFEKSQMFYGTLFGWSFLSHKDEYVLIKAGESFIGGLRTIHGNKIQGDSPTIYITVDDIDVSSSNAKTLGAQLVGEKVSTGENCGEFQLFLDVDQNLMAMYAQYK